jgi:hypothetical protein
MYDQYDFKRFDGGVVRIAGDHQEAVEWYCRHLQLKKGWHSPEDGMTGLCYPSGFAMSLENAKPGIEYASESNIRFCFETVNMENSPFSEFYIYDPDGNRINFWFYGGEVA